MYQHPHFYHVTNEYFLLKKCIFHDFGIMDLRTTEPFRSDSRTFFSNLRTFGLKNLRTHEPSNLRTFGLIGCNPPPRLWTINSASAVLSGWCRSRVPEKRLGVCLNIIGGKRNILLIQGCINHTFTARWVAGRYLGATGTYRQQMVHWFK